MYSYIKGTVAGTGENFITIDVGGIGYKLFAPVRILDGCKVGEQMQLFTKMVVREDDISLYGFESEAERTMFEKVTSVSGVGAKTGLAMLSVMTSADIAAAILSADTNAFSKVPGVGKKTAQRIILDLKDNVNAEDIMSGTPKSSLSGAPQEAAEALISLGYSRSEANAAVAAVKELGDTTEELTLLALKRLSR